MFIAAENVKIRTHDKRKKKQVSTCLLVVAIFGLYLMELQHNDKILQLPFIASYNLGQFLKKKLKHMVSDTRHTLTLTVIQIATDCMQISLYHCIFHSTCPMFICMSFSCIVYVSVDLITLSFLYLLTPIAGNSYRRFYCIRIFLYYLHISILSTHFYSIYIFYIIYM